MFEFTYTGMCVPNHLLWWPAMTAIEMWWKGVGVVCIVGENIQNKFQEFCMVGWPNTEYQIYWPLGEASGCDTLGRSRWNFACVVHKLCGHRSHGHVILCAVFPLLIGCCWLMQVKGQCHTLSPLNLCCTWIRLEAWVAYVCGLRISAVPEIYMAQFSLLRIWPLGVSAFLQKSRYAICNKVNHGKSRKYIKKL